MFKFSENSTYNMPAHFGGTEGPPRPAPYHDVTSISIFYETDGEALAQYIPEAFQLTEPVISIQCAFSRGIDWMNGGSYSLISIQVPVAYVHGRERMDGYYALVIWENKATPIISGREQSGMPKTFANIEDYHQVGDRVFTNASYEGRTFLEIDFQKTAKMNAEELSLFNQKYGKVNWFGWRYIPNIGRSGAALSHATVFPQEAPCTAGWRGNGTVRWQALTPEQHPTQAHIIRALSQLPIRAYRDCAMTLGSLILRNDTARQLP